MALHAAILGFIVILGLNNRWSTFIEQIGDYLARP
jgi:hypothetical protein